MAAKVFIVNLPDGTRHGNTRGLRQCHAEGWSILAGEYWEVRHAPRAPRDPRPWTDGLLRFRALDCWAVPPHRRNARP
ncbi:hypothetical protein [Kitasatospora sp. NPDC001527]|uniref:hypothetical protein n=1 Tax=Kitasatospora sp. NPDC001527 TaxID=3154519 RepID=UPI003330A405